MRPFNVQLFCAHLSSGTTQGQSFCSGQWQFKAPRQISRKNPRPGSEIICGTVRHKVTQANADNPDKSSISTVMQVAHFLLSCLKSPFFQTSQPDGYQTPCLDTLKKWLPPSPAQPGASSCASSTSKAGLVLRSPNNHMDKTWCSQHMFPISSISNPPLRLSNKASHHQEGDSNLHEQVLPKTIPSIAQDEISHYQRKEKCYCWKGEKISTTEFFYFSVFTHLSAHRKCERPFEISFYTTNLEIKIMYEYYELRY